MGLSKTTRIGILLVIDTCFFLLELIIGYAVHSLALVADAFHMLNDILSLCVGLWAVRVAASGKISKQYTYGWQRAEILGALLNGVFLIALCLSIFLEAISRFVEPQEISNPGLVLVVGCCGLVSNILGLLLFHDHGHGGHGHAHGGDGHSHGGLAESAAEEGQASRVDRATREVADEHGNIADVLPENSIAGWPRTKQIDTNGTAKGKRDSTTAAVSSSRAMRKATVKHRQRTSGSRNRLSDVNDMPTHPATFRNKIINAGNYSGDGVEKEDETEEHAVTEDTQAEPSESAPLTGQHDDHGYGSTTHAGHNHRQPKDTSEKSGGGGHSHHDLNMRGVFLHVMGDALGNIGVIAAALFIWLTDFDWRFYADPVISLIITCIILVSAIPLCKAASRILLQAVPPGIEVDKIKADIEGLSGVLTCHHLHVWQLTDTKLVASLHVQIDFDMGSGKTEGSTRYMALAKEIHVCLHEHGIDSSTIQPEFCTEPRHLHASGWNGGSGSSSTESVAATVVAGSSSDGGTVMIATDPETCLMECDDNCGSSITGQCCEPTAANSRFASRATSPGGGDHDGHVHH